MWLGCVAIVALSAGCEKPLLDPLEERSPFQRYDAVRNQDSEQKVFDEFGRKKPNIRERLMPKD